VSARTVLAHPLPSPAQMARASRAERDTPRCGVCDQPSPTPLCHRCAPLVGPIVEHAVEPGSCPSCPPPPLARRAGHDGACT
jgi:hypothetical protein